MLKTGFGHTPLHKHCSRHYIRGLCIVKVNRNVAEVACWDLCPLYIISLIICNSRKKYLVVIVTSSKTAFFACFWAYIEQPHDHISWATPMLFASINSTNPKTNPWNFHEKILRIGGRSWKMRFFEAAILNFLSRPFWFFFYFISVKSPALLIEVSFFSALWMVFPESCKRRVADFYAHDCRLAQF